MKNNIKYLLILFAISNVFTSCVNNKSFAQPQPNEEQQLYYNDNNPVTYQNFYDNLSPYGTWINYPQYGHVWSPRLGPDFRPYATNGHWVSTAEGWAWSSQYNWGWAPFHYGRWMYDDLYGWLWVPGYDWSPAWVTWGNVDNYYCWAPLIPGINIGVRFDTWRPHSFYWNACSRERIYDRNLFGVLENRERIEVFQNRVTIINNFNTTQRHNVYYAKGPEEREVERYVKQKITTTPTREVQRVKDVKPMQKEMKVYRPPVQEPENTNRQNPQKRMQPKEYRTATPTETRPINREEQRPVMKYYEQNKNIERLPVNKADGYGGQKNNGNNNNGGKGNGDGKKFRDGGR